MVCELEYVCLKNVFLLLNGTSNMYTVTVNVEKKKRKKRNLCDEI